MPNRNDMYALIQKDFAAWVDRWEIKCDPEEATRKGSNKYSGSNGRVGPGWIPILDSLAKDLIDLGWDKELLQVKEKFGSLRFYISAHSPEITDRIQQAYNEADAHCEWCGEESNISRTSTGWMKNFCETCKKVSENVS